MYFSAVSSSPGRITLLGKRPAKALALAPHGIRLIVGHREAAVVILGRTLQELGEGPSLEGRPLHG